MKKFVIVNLVLFLTVYTGSAQSYEASVEINKKFESAVCIDLSYSVKDIEATLEKRFAANGLKGKNSKGFTEYKGKFSEFTSETVTIYTKVEKSKLNKNDSKLSILVARPDGEFCSSATCEYTIGNVKKFANNLTPHVEVYVTNVQLDKSNDELKKAEKELKKLQDDAISLERDKEKILKKIEENAQNILNKQKEVEMKSQIANEIHVKKLKQEADLPK